MSVYTVMDKLESTIKEGIWLPFGARIVSQDRLLDLVEKLRSSLPDEVSRAKAVTKEKDRLISDAKAQATAMVEQASTAKAQLLSDAEITREAQDRANALTREAQEHAAQLVADAERHAREVRRGADEYADGVLRQLDVSLGNALAAVHKGREQLAASLSANGDPGARDRR